MSACTTAILEYNRLGLIASYQFVKTDGENEAFIELCGKLDATLNTIIGSEKQQKQYDQYNQCDSIHDTIIIYHDNKRCVEQVLVKSLCADWRQMQESQAFVMQS